MTQPSGENGKKRKAPCDRSKPDAHPECDRCKERKKHPSEKSEWNRFLKDFQYRNPDMALGESLIEARKRYVPKNGKLKSYERLWRDVWRAKNPAWKSMASEEWRGKMREDFLDAI